MLADIRKTLLKSGNDGMAIQNIEETIKAISPDIKRSIYDSTVVWKEKNQVKVIELSPKGMSEVWDHYFSGKGAFRKPKHRDDIPDAAISLCILEAMNTEDNLTVVCRDGQLKRYLSESKGLTLRDELSEFIAQDEVQKTLRRLDSHDASVEAIKETLQSASLKNSIIFYISQEKSDLYYACWKNEEVSGCEKLPLPLAGGITVDGPIVESITEISFGALSSIAPKHFVMPLDFTAQVQVGFAATYYDWLQLPEFQKKAYPFDSMDGDGICDVTAIVPARLSGQIVVHLLQDMTPEIIKTHAEFIGHEKCYLDVEYVAGKVTLL